MFYHGSPPVDSSAAWAIPAVLSPFLIVNDLGPMGGMYYWTTFASSQTYWLLFKMSCLPLQKKYDIQRARDPQALCMALWELDSLNPTTTEGGVDRQRSPSCRQWQRLPCYFTGPGGVVVVVG